MTSWLAQPVADQLTTWGLRSLATEPPQRRTPEQIGFARALRPSACADTLAGTSRAMLGFAGIGGGIQTPHSRLYFLELDGESASQDNALHHWQMHEAYLEGQVATP